MASPRKRVPPCSPMPRTVAKNKTARRPPGLAADYQQRYSWDASKGRSPSIFIRRAGFAGPRSGHTASYINFRP